ncbi:hypothetical protein LTS08_007348 [Lithohypha guttulata]|uniref:Uncharacterized protein n=1 Tax=Lithohypha guttulata TaxID=1690604 RepID=A0AAN7TB60_9EURO|nr:hypothetical protein LTR05_000258 [Lithohypha guttulata]KAK5096858.1 hypothetical protein LTS08_007348 [Lithohypha guttulata]
MAPPSQEVLFSLQIPAHKSPAAPSPGGTITVSRLSLTPSLPRDATAFQSMSSNPAHGRARPRHGDQPPPPPIYLLTHHSPPDNRLTPPFLQTYLHALLRLQHGDYPYGILLTTSSITKFFSNGLDLATFQPSDKPRYLYPLWRKLLTYPMPTCAVINGHGFAGGLMLSMFHDFRIMNPHRGWLCLNELEFDAELAPAMASIFKAKLTNSTFRSLLLEARRFTSLQALEYGLVDGLGGLEEAVNVMTDVEGGHGRAGMVVSVRGRGTVYGKLKEEMYKDVLTQLEMSELEETQIVERRMLDRVMRDKEEKILIERLGGVEKAKL